MWSKALIIVRDWHRYHGESSLSVSLLWLINHFQGLFWWARSRTTSRFTHSLIPQKGLTLVTVSSSSSFQMTGPKKLTEECSARTLRLYACKWQILTTLRKFLSAKRLFVRRIWYRRSFRQGFRIFNEQKMPVSSKNRIVTGIPVRGYHSSCGTSLTPP